MLNDVAKAEAAERNRHISEFIFLFYEPTTHKKTSNFLMTVTTMRVHTNHKTLQSRSSRFHSPEVKVAVTQNYHIAKHEFSTLIRKAIKNTNLTEDNQPFN